MKNLFDTANHPDQVPEQLVAGALWAWSRRDITAAYPTSEYTLLFLLSLQEKPFSTYELTASKAGGRHTVFETNTAERKPGDYRWQAVVVRDSDSARVVVDAGMTRVTPQFDSQAGDTRSWVYQTLMAIRAVIQGTASREVASYSVAGRSLTARTPAELLELEKEFAKRWQREQEANGKRRVTRTLVGMRA